MNAKVTGKANLRRWNLETIEQANQALESVILRAAGEAIDLALRDDETIAFFPLYEGRRRAKQHPLEVHFAVALNEAGRSIRSAHPVFKTNLREMLADDIAECARDGSWSRSLSLLSEGLKHLAADIDRAVSSAATQEDRQ